MMDNYQRFEELLRRFQDLLRKLFQFETSDLDFGIFRVLNYKRDRIERFIEEELRNKVETAFAKHKGEIIADIDERLEKAREKVIENLGESAFTATGDIKEELKQTPVAKEFLHIKKQKDKFTPIDEIRSQVFNDLYNFFSRYYEEGDFVPQHRYSIKGHKYAIPYNGEEIKLYWANQGQYYTKTGILFRDYTFRVHDYKVMFRIVSAKEEVGSNKATKERFFVLDDEKPITVEDKRLIIHFQYRELTEEEIKHYGVEGGSNTSKQEKINDRSCNDILEKVADITLKGELGKNYKNDKTLLSYQIHRFTAKNTKDYFIHKDLRKFLSEQLDYFIKSEVLDIEAIEKGRSLEKHITRAKVVREIGEDIIDFLSQIEDFQKRLWEKKKFVIKTEYVITLDKIKEYAGEDFLNEVIDEVLKNEIQLNEWRELGFGEIKSKDNLFLKNDLVEKTYKKLPIDTKYFSEDFKEKLLGKLTEKHDLDDLLDGLVIKSENWQALNLLLNKYKEKVQTIYIDPPYNTGSDEFLYRDRYQHSSWLTMIENRLSLARELMRDDGVIFISIDDNERDNLGNLLYLLNYQEIEILKIKMREPSRQLTQRALFQKSIEYCFCYAKSTKPAIKLPKVEYDFSEYKYKIIENEKPNRTFSVGKYKVDEFLPGQYEIIEINDINDPYITKAISIRGKIKNAQFTGKFYEEHLRPILETNKEKNYDILYKVYDIGEDGFGFRYIKNPSRHTINAVYYQGIPLQVRKSISEAIKEKSYYDFYDFQKAMNNENKKMRELGLLTILSIKPVDLIEFVLSMVREREVIIDFFAGSGTTAHAVMKLNKEDGGKRKFILVEMADYFDSLIIPRLKKVAYSFNWKEGKPQDTDGIGISFKYQILEQYEDTLDNIELKENKQAEELLKHEYLLKYFLDFETKESPYLLNIEHLKNPFAYKLKVNLEEVGEPEEVVVDIPETFNYLLGIKVKKIKVRNNERKYLFILGEKESKDIAIVWREYSDNWGEDDFKEDKEFIIKELENWKPQVVYINGQSVLTPKNWEVRYIEPEFRRIMET